MAEVLRSPEQSVTSSSGGEVAAGTQKQQVFPAELA